MPYELSNRHNLSYALPVIATTCLMSPIGVLQGVYAKYYGLSLATIAFILLLTRLFDAVSDPLVGYFADRFYQSTGTYKPIIFIGGLLFIISSYFLYAPPLEVSAFYLTCWLLTFYLAWTLFEMPHLAWGSQLAQTSDEKTRIYGFRSMAGYIGSLIFFLTPLLPIFESNSITPKTLSTIVLIVSVLMIPFFTLCLRIKLTTHHKPNLLLIAKRKKTSRYTLARQLPILDFLQSFFDNSPLLIFLGAYLLIMLGAGMWSSLIFLYIDVYLGMGDQFAKTFLFAMIFGILVTPVWYKLSIWWGKKTICLVAIIFMVISFICTGFLSPEKTSFTELVVFKAFHTVGISGVTIMAPAMLSEIIDYSNWKSRSEKNAIYFSIYTFISKTSVAIAITLGLSIAGWYGFDATINSQSEHAIFGITLAISWLPSLFGLLSMVFILFYPINKRRHQIIRRRLDVIARRQDKC